MHNFKKSTKDRIKFKRPQKFKSIFIIISKISGKFLKKQKEYMSYYVNEEYGLVELNLEQLQAIMIKSYGRIEVLELLETVRRGVSLAWSMICLIFMFMMQAGFCLMSTGAARTKNKASILTHSILIVCLTSLVYSFLSSYLVFEAEGGLLGIHKNNPLVTKNGLQPSTLDTMSSELFSFMKILTCATIACIQL